MHPQAEIIYGVLAELFGHMIDEGYVPDKRYILSYVNQDEKGLPMNDDRLLASKLSCEEN